MTTKGFESRISCTTEDLPNLLISKVQLVNNCSRMQESLCSSPLVVTRARSSYRRYSVKQGILKYFANFTEKQVLGLQLYQKETLTQVFSCEICEIFKNTYLEEYLRTTVSVELVILDNLEHVISEKQYFF